VDCNYVAHNIVKFGRSVGYGGCVTGNKKNSVLFRSYRGAIAYLESERYAMHI
jgi:hypothetical protein